jgi:VCBS repeat-containing protein
MLARPAAYARLILGILLCLAVPFSVHAQSCTPPAIQQIAGGPGNCAGEPVTLDAGDGWVTYVWSNEATGRYMTDAPLVNTVYTVTVTDANGCTVTSQPFEIYVQGTNVAPVIDTPDTMCDAGAVQTATVGAPTKSGKGGEVQ